VRFVVAIVFLPFCLDVAALTIDSLFADFAVAQGKSILFDRHSTERRRR
jgi:hypothetical protein